MQSRRRAFTLIEMLLVIIIIGVITAVTLPQFVKSMHGNRIKAAARTVIAAGRYARSMAILQQRPMVLSFNLDQGSLQIAEGHVRNRDRMINPDDSDDAQGDDEKSADAVGVAGLADGAGDKREPLLKSSKTVKLERKLEKVTIEQVEIEGGETVASGSCRIVYATNGRCTPYRVKLSDASGMTILIKVDALASAETERQAR